LSISYSRDIFPSKVRSQQWKCPSTIAAGRLDRSGQNLDEMLFV